MLRIPVVVSVLALSGCAIHQTVTPVAPFQASEICLIENPAVKPGFVEAYKRTLIGKGYAVKQMPLSSAMTDCAVMSTYSANWRWDMALYMEYAEIKVYRDAKPIGEAKYDAKRGGGNMSKFIDADKKVTELVNQLFPGNAPGARPPG